LNDVPANIRIEELKAWDFALGGVRAQACHACHPGVCVGYRLSVSGRSIAFFPDNELRHENNGHSGTHHNTNGKPNVRQNGERTLAEFIQGVDALVMDAQYDAQEYERHVGWGHGCVDKVVALALEANVRQLFLFHHDPNHDDAKISEMVAHARELVTAQGGSLQVEAAREGLTVELQ
jgi:hypothetical protein